MKRVFFLAAISLCLLPELSRGADAGTEERFNQLTGKIQDIIASQEAQRKQLDELSREVQSLRDEQSKPSPNYASQDDLKRLAEALKEVDRKRMDDNDKIHDELLRLAKKLSMPAPAAPRHSASSNDENPAPSADKKGYEYVIKPGDTLSMIVQAYKEQNIKVTVEQILQANPGLKPERLVVGKSIFIPAPSK